MLQLAVHVDKGEETGVGECLDRSVGSDQLGTDGGEFKCPADQVAAEDALGHILLLRIHPLPGVAHQVFFDVLIKMMSGVWGIIKKPLDNSRRARYKKEVAIDFFSQIAFFRCFL